MRGELDRAGGPVGGRLQREGWVSGFGGGLERLRGCGGWLRGGERGRGGPGQNAGTYMALEQGGGCRRNSRCAGFKRGGAVLGSCRLSSTSSTRARAAVDPAGAAAARPLLQVSTRPQRAAAHGAARLQHAVPLVRRSWRWMTRSGTQRCSPRTGSGCWPATSRRRSSRRCAPGRGEGPVVGRALHGRRHLDRSMGGTKSFKRKEG